MSFLFFKKSFIVFIALFLVGCNVQAKQISTYPVDQSFVNDSNRQLNLTIGGGRLNLSAGETDAITGEIQINEAEWQPAIQNEGNLITIAQSDISRFSKLPNEKTINDWNLQLGNSPLALNIEARATTNNINLTDIPLTSLTFLDSLTTTEIYFDAQNPEKLERFDIGSSGSNFVFRGISNANFEQMNVRTVGGSYVLDFSGDLQQDANITLIAGLGNLRVEIPKEIPVSITVSGIVSGLETEGDWDSNQNVYTNPGDGHQLFFDINMDMGKLVLVLK